MQITELDAEILASLFILSQVEIFKEKHPELDVLSKDLLTTYFDDRIPATKSVLSVLITYYDDPAEWCRVKIQLIHTLATKEHNELCAIIGPKCLHCEHDDIRVLCIDYIDNCNLRGWLSFHKSDNLKKYQSNQELAKQELQVLCLNCLTKRYV